MNFSSDNRQKYIQDLKAQNLDLLIIGGGITGAGILLDAQVRGMKAGLIEMQDFASGTSSRSTKLVHGGLRYLKQLEIKLVAEVGKERAIVFENGPHVTRAESMLLPLIKGGSIGSLGAFFGMKVYDMLANVKKEEQRRMLSKAETLNKEPLLKEELLNAGVYYFEYRTDDARLTIEVIKEAVDRKGIAVNYLKAVEFLFDNKKKIIGIIAKDQLTGEEHKIYAKYVVNATGPWVDNVDYLNDRRAGKKLHLTKGVHIVIDHKKLPISQAIYFDTADGRMVFAIPREGKTYAGTTDTTYEGAIDNPLITKEDREYLVSAINYIFKLKITDSDIESGWAGLRPLIKQKGKDPSAISRKDEIFQSDTGLITIAGGKLTGYRKMAERIVDLVASRFKKEDIKFPSCSTDKVPISGGKVGGSAEFKNFLQTKTSQLINYGIPAQQAQELVHRYGSNIDKVFEIIKNTKEESAKNNLPSLLFAQLIYSLEEEMAINPSDFFIRRTGALYFNISMVKQHRDSVSSYLATRFNWTTETKEAYDKELTKLITQAE